MRISPPDDGIYAVVDQAKMDDRDKGFTKVRLKLRNTTPDITVRDDSGGEILKQPIGAGAIQAVAKYRRNGCYEIDLRGEPDPSTASTQQMPNGCGLNTFIGGREFISISLSENIVEVPSDRDKELEFDFSSDPIPIDARDLVIQVIFKGMLGVDDGIAEGALADGPDEESAVHIRDSSGRRRV
ncbi:MAG: hypothetical protein BMS9Abin37_2803 [Acidobacteriota bacterium]|nr:MAG: hypothetical protein BMS9Abin37_2803 [Acidobacteriota bacterium]